MSAVLPIESYRTAIVEITQSVFDTMLTVAVQPAGQPFEKSTAALIAAVYYAGEWKGALLLECSLKQAIDWTSRLMSLPPAASVNDDVKDGLGELVNVLAGNLKAILPPGVALSIPSIVEGTDYSLRICRGNPFEVLSFEDSNGPFAITLVEVLS
jgi:chemotaxis protein CheX